MSSNSQICVDAPIKWGFLAFSGVDLLDVYGPLGLLYLVAATQHLQVTIITPTNEDVVITPPLGNRFNSTYQPVIVGKATFDDDLDLDILVVPGGAAARDTSMTYVDDYVVEKLPSLRYLLTICTGAIFAARGGVFNNRRATTNKNAWNLVTAHGENVTWVAPARFVIDDNLWSSSGVRGLPSTQPVSGRIPGEMRGADDEATGYIWHGFDHRVHPPVLRRGNV